MKMQHQTTTSELEQTLLREAIAPRGINLEQQSSQIQEAIDFVQDRMRKAAFKSQVLVALDYLARYGYTSRYTPTRMNGR